MRKLALLLVLLFPGSVYADVNYEAEQPPHVVKIIVGYSKYIDIGTGTLIGNNRILTVYHNIRDSKTGDNIYVEFFDGSISNAKILKTDKTQDLALLEITPVLYSAIKISSKPTLMDQTVIISGFPKGKDYGEVVGQVIMRHIVTKDAKIPTIYVVSDECIQGMSGGPVTNTKGFLVGVLFGATEGVSYCSDWGAVTKFLE